MRTIRTLIAASCLLVTVNTLDISATDESPWSPEGVVARIDIPVNGEPLQVNVRLDGVDKSFIIDTGSYATVLSDSVRPGDLFDFEAGLSSRTISAFSVLGVKCPWLKSVIVLDLTHTQSAGIKADGILGVDVLSHFVVHFDFDNGKFLLCKPNQMLRPPGTKAPLLFDEFERPCIEASFDDRRPLQFLIDTGNLVCCCVVKDEFTGLSKHSTSLPTGVRVNSNNVVGDKSALNQIRCRSLKLVGHKLENIVIAESDANVIGLQQLCRFRLTLDFANSQSYWQPGTRYAYRDRGDYGGLVYKQNDRGDLEVLSVSKNGPAENAGLKTGDLIVVIEGREVRERTGGYWSRVFSFPRIEPIKMFVKRDGVTFPMIIAEN